MIIWIKELETKSIQSGKNKGNLYDSAKIIDGTGKNRTLSLFDPDHKKLFSEALKDNLAIDAVMKQEGQYLNFVSGQLVSEELEPLEKTPPNMEPIRDSAKPVGKAPARSEPAPQELGMWWKELGEWLRVKEDVEAKPPLWKELRAIYFAKMFNVLDLKVEK